MTTKVDAMNLTRKFHKSDKIVKKDLFHFMEFSP